VAADIALLAVGGTVLHSGGRPAGLGAVPLGTEAAHLLAEREQPDVLLLPGRPACAFEQFATEYAAAFS
jgi:hypothetical protein